MNEMWMRSKYANENKALCEHFKYNFWMRCYVRYDHGKRKPYDHFFTHTLWMRFKWDLKFVCLMYIIWMKCQEKYNYEKG